MIRFNHFLSKIKKRVINDLILEKKPLDTKKSGSKMMTLPKKWLDKHKVDTDVLLLNSAKAPHILVITPLDMEIREFRSQVESLHRHLRRVNALKIT